MNLHSGVGPFAMSFLPRAVANYGSTLVVQIEISFNW